MATAVAGLLWGGLVTATPADVIHLTHGGTIEVEAWRDAGDAIEFARGGGIVRILKSDIRRIEGDTRTEDLRMRATTPGPAGPGAGASPPTAAREMASLLKEGDALFAQTVLDAQTKAGAFRRLTERWRALDVPDPLRELHGRGERALQVSAEAFAAEAEGVTPDARERIEEARKSFAEVLAELERMTKEG
jgi:hypothetical protein